MKVKAKARARPSRHQSSFNPSMVRFTVFRSLYPFLHLGESCQHSPGGYFVQSELMDGSASSEVFDLLLVGQWARRIGVERRRRGAQRRARTAPRRRNKLSHFHGAVQSSSVLGVPVVFFTGVQATWRPSPLALLSPSRGSLARSPHNRLFASRSSQVPHSTVQTAEA